MALEPVDEAHALQIQAGTLGRKTGHAFEDEICNEINRLKYPVIRSPIEGRHLFTGDPAKALIGYLLRYYNEPELLSATALSTGALATSEEGREWLQINGADVRRCKSDIVISAAFTKERTATVGISTKQCNNIKPTNAQLYFTTASAFAALLRSNGIRVSDNAVTALRQFCGDAGFRPSDTKAIKGRKTDPRRFFWEELPDAGREEWERTFSKQQDKITRLLLQKAYLDDPFLPDFLIHKTRRASAWRSTEVAIYGIDELVSLSRAYQRFAVKPYSVRKGSHRDPPGTTHSAPRFGIVQMQRGGQAQHPTQLQFNLETGYFYRLENL